MTRTRDVATQGGLVLLNTTTVTTSTGTQINNLFSSTYDQYFMTWTGTGTVNSGDLAARFSASGTPNSSSLYFYGGLHVTNASGPTRIYQGLQTSFYLGALADISGSMFNYINNPFVASPTNGSYSYSMWGTTANYTGQGGFSHNNAVSYDGINIFPLSGTMTGTFKFYGIKK